uniref:Calcyclin-binding protein n=1 Tax=Panagrellus redivivus TaxID=6233 RepID=A0A7E4UWD3_PANRE
MTSEVQLDLTELEVLLAQTTRPVVKQTLNELKTRLTNKLTQIQFAAAANAAPSKPKANPLRPTLKVTTYAYDESENFVKLYYTVNGVQNLPADRVVSKFTEDSFEVTITDLDGKDYSISAKGFAHPINPDKSVVKQKTDNILVMLKKAETGTWSELLKIVQQKKEERKRQDEADMAAGAAGDPQAGIMSMMKKMYDEGDDDMKRNLRKAWHESQNKQGGGAGGAGGLPGMPGMPNLGDLGLDL